MPSSCSLKSHVDFDLIQSRLEPIPSRVASTKHIPPDLPCAFTASIAPVIQSIPSTINNE